MFYSREFKRAFQPAKQKYPFLIKGCGWYFIQAVTTRHHANKTEGFNEPFGETIRHVLNAHDIIGEHRSAYSSLAGFYFGKRGNTVQKTRPSPSIKQRRRSPVRILLEPTGQYALEI